MHQNNFLQVGETVHCLHCHFEIKRDDFLKHAELHTVSKATACFDTCPDWVRDYQRRTIPSLT